MTAWLDNLNDILNSDKKVSNDIKLKYESQKNYNINTIYFQSKMIIITKNDPKNL